jgi:hypothetical protein
VQSHTATTITIAGDWRVPPASDSKITLAYNNRNVVIYANEMNAFPAGFSNTANASCAFDFDGNTWESVGEANVSHRTSGTVRICGGGTNPSCWNDLRGHRGFEAYWGAQLMAWEWEQCQSTGPWLLGNAIRGSSFGVAAAQPAAGWWGSCLGTGLVNASYITDSSTVIAGCIIEHNAGAGGQRGYYLEGWTNALYRKNTTDKSIGMSANAQCILLENTHPGAPSQTNGRAIPLPLLRVAQFALLPPQAIDSAVIPIANGGVQSMTWSVSTTDSWIAASVASGATVNAEGTTGQLKIRVTKPANFAQRQWGIVKIVTQAGDSTSVGVLIEPQGSASTAAGLTANTSGVWARIVQSPTGSLRLIFGLAARSDVALDLFDAQGRSVWHVALMQQPPGMNTVEVRPRMMSSGFHIAKLHIGDDFRRIDRVIVR